MPEPPDAGADVIRLKGSGTINGWTATYLLGSRNVTKQVVAGTWHTTSLGIGKSVTIKVVISVPKAAKVGASKVWNILATSTNNTAKKDDVKASVKAIA